MLRRRAYVTAARSACLPGLDVEWIADLAQVEPTSTAIKRLRAALRKQRRR